MEAQDAIVRCARATNMKSVTAVINLPANAYGHGLITVSQALEQDPHVHAFAVARLPEAMELREAGIKKPVVLLEGFLNAEDVQVIAEQGFFTASRSKPLSAPLLTSQSTLGSRSILACTA